MSSRDRPRTADRATPERQSRSSPSEALGFRGRARRVATRFLVWLAAWLKYLTLLATALTWRKTVDGLDELDARLASGTRCLVVFWHGKYLALSPLLRGRHACVFTSASRRGSQVADICVRFGFVPVQIPDEKNADKLERMKEGLRKHRAGAIAVDGPVGPYHFVKRGAVTLASELGYDIVPVSMACDRAHVLSQRWDRMELPKLFSRVCLRVAPPIRVPPGIDELQVLQLSDVLHDALEALDQSAAERLRG